MKKRELRCVIAGFDPFGGASFNPSGELAQAFPDLITIRGQGSVAVEKLLLPTCCDQSWKVLKKALKKFKNDEIVLIIAGLAESRMTISLERVALNLREYRIADNNGHKFPACKIHSDDENALFTTVPVDKVKKALIKKGIPCDVSNHAGTFVCNEIYFKALSYQSWHKNLKAVLFIHVPLPKNFIAKIEQSKNKPALKSYGKGASKRDKHQALAMMQESVQLALLECIKYMDKAEHLG